MASASPENKSATNSGDVSDDEGEFQDAEASFAAPTQPVGEMTTENAVIEMYRAIDLFLENKFADAEELAKTWASTSMYHALAAGLLAFLHAFLSGEKALIDSAVVTLRHARHLADSKRKHQGAMKSMSSWFLGKDFSSFSRDEMEAELIYTECLLMRGMLTFLQDEGLVSFARGGLKIRACYKSYKECFDLIKQSGKTGHEFTSGVKYGFGTFNLLMSLLPQRILSLLEFIGYSGNKVLGLQLLNDCSSGEISLRTFACQLLLLTYHTIIPYVLGLGDGDLDEATRLVETTLTKYPKGALYLFFKGRLLVIQGQMDEAESWLQKSISSQQQWPQLHHLCYWEIFWTHCFRQKWQDAAKYANLLFTENKWSKATYLYMLSAVRLMTVEKSSPEYDEVVEQMKKIPSFKIRIAGRSVPFEKFAIQRHERFIKRGYLFFPAAELLYMWNGFAILERNEELLIQMHKSIRAAAAQDVSDDPDDHCLAELLDAVCLRGLGKVEEALEKFLEMLQYSRNSGLVETYLQPYGHVEIGLCLMQLKRYDEAKQHLETARTDFKKYALQSRLHFRIHAAMKIIGGET